MAVSNKRACLWTLALAVASAGCGAEGGAAGSGYGDGGGDGVAADASRAQDIGSGADGATELDGGADAGADGGAGTLADAGSVICCPMAAGPSCDCTKIGGTADDNGNCPSVCDAAPVGWKKIVDDNGCPKWAPGPESCLTVDAGTSEADAADAGVADAGAADAGVADGGGADATDDTTVSDGGWSDGGWSDTNWSDSAWTDGSGDVLAGVSCGAGNVVFPKFDKSCQTANDCVLVEHQINCCGTRAAWGISKGANDAFNAAEALCQQQYPKCKCAATPTMAEDGNTTTNGGSFAVSCFQGQCWSYVDK